MNQKKLYTVRVSHDVTEQCEVQVMANSDKEAIELARNVGLSEMDWQMTDAIGDNQYDIIPD